MILRWMFLLWISFLFSFPADPLVWPQEVPGPVLNSARSQKSGMSGNQHLESGTPKSAPSEQEIRQALQKLTADDYRVRGRAEKRLRAWGPSIEPWLQAYLENSQATPLQRIVVRKLLAEYAQQKEEEEARVRDPLRAPLERAIAQYLEFAVRRLRFQPASSNTNSSSPRQALSLNPGNNLSLLKMFLPLLKAYSPKNDQGLRSLSLFENSVLVIFLNPGKPQTKFRKLVLYDPWSVDLPSLQEQFKNPSEFRTPLYIPYSLKTTRFIFIFGLGNEFLFQVFQPPQFRKLMSLTPTDAALFSLRVSYFPATAHEKDKVSVAFNCENCDIVNLKRLCPVPGKVSQNLPPCQKALMEGDTAAEDEIGKTLFPLEAEQVLALWNSLAEGEATGVGEKMLPSEPQTTPLLIGQTSKVAKKIPSHQDYQQWLEQLQEPQEGKRETAYEKLKMYHELFSKDLIESYRTGQMEWGGRHLLHDLLFETGLWLNIPELVREKEREIHKLIQFISLSVEEDPVDVETSSSKEAVPCLFTFHTLSLKAFLDEPKQEKEMEQLLQKGAPNLNAYLTPSERTPVLAYFLYWMNERGADFFEPESIRAFSNKILSQKGATRETDLNRFLALVLQNRIPSKVVSDPKAEATIPPAQKDELQALLAGHPARQCFFKRYGQAPFPGSSAAQVPPAGPGKEKSGLIPH